MILMVHSADEAIRSDGELRSSKLPKRQVRKNSAPRSGPDFEDDVRLQTIRFKSLPPALSSLSEDNACATMSALKDKVSAAELSKSKDLKSKPVRYPFWFGGSASCFAACVTHPLDLGMASMALIEGIHR